MEFCYKIFQILILANNVKHYKTAGGNLAPVESNLEMIDIIRAITPLPGDNLSQIL